MSIKFGDFMDCGSKNIFIVTSQIWQIMGRLKRQKLEYLENGI